MVAACMHGERPPHLVGLAVRVTHAHGGREAWAATEALATDVTVLVAGRVEARGELVWAIGSGTTSWTPGRDAAGAEEGTVAGVTEEEIATWTRLLGAPFLLDSPGNLLYEQDSGLLGGVRGLRGSLTFEPEVGAVPGERYIVWVDPRTDRLRALASADRFFPIRAGEGRPLLELGPRPFVATFDRFVERSGLRLPAVVTVHGGSEPSDSDPRRRIVFENLRTVRWQPAEGRNDETIRSEDD
jgi:hypothetical protein